MQRSAGQPFFLYINYADPHKELNTKPPGFPAQANGIPETPFNPGDIPAWPFQRVENPEILENAANFYNCVQRVDAGMGMLLDALKASGKNENTIIVFMGDNGPPFARGKTSCYEAGLRTPLLVRWPGVSQAGLVSQALVCSVDIMPTLLDAAGVSPPGMQGRPMRMLLQGDARNWRTYMAGEFHFHTGSYFFPRRAIRDDRYKLIYNPLSGRVKPPAKVDGDNAAAVAASKKYNGTAAQRAMKRLGDPPPWELYDLEKDPWEFENLAGDPARKTTLVRMQKALTDWQDETGDPFRDPKLIEKTLKETLEKKEIPNDSVK
jgi:N-sulfoglucosamine sulfohydrolase